MPNDNEQQLKGEGEGVGGAGVGGGIQRVILSHMTCPFSDCQETWNPRTPNPMRCPRCGRALRKTKRLLNKKKIEKGDTFADGSPRKFDPPVRYTKEDLDEERMP